MNPYRILFRTLGLVGMLSLLPGCSQDSSNRQANGASDLHDIAGWSPDVPSNVDVLYFYDSGRFFRVTCPRGTVLFDRANCQEQPTDVSAAVLMNRLRDEVSQRFPELDRKHGQLEARIERIERRQLELVLVNPAPSQPQLLREVERIEGERAVIEANLASLREQRARLEAEIRRSPDGDLQNQLAIVHEQLAAEEQRLNVCNRNLNNARQQFVRANASLLDPTVYQELESERRMVAQEIDNVVAQRRVVVDKMLVVEKVFVRLMDGGYTYDFSVETPQNRPMLEVFSRFSTLFSDQDIHERTFAPVVDLENSIVRIAVNRTGKLSKMLCRLDTNPDMQCTIFRLKAPTGEVFDFGAQGGFALNYPNICEGAACGVFELPARGEWTVQPICRMTGIGGTRALRGVDVNWTCSIQVRN